MKNKLKDMSRDELMKFADGGSSLSNQFIDSLSGAAIGTIIVITMYALDAYSLSGTAYMHLTPAAWSIFMVALMVATLNSHTNRRLSALIQLLRKSELIAEEIPQDTKK